jgi:hypothetical protein
MLMITQAEKLVLTEAFERAQHNGQERSECYRVAVATLRALHPNAPMESVALQAVNIVLEHAHWP